MAHLSIQYDGGVNLRDNLGLLPPKLILHALHVLGYGFGGLPLPEDPRYDPVDGLDGHDAPGHPVEGGGVGVLGGNFKGMKKIPTKVSQESN